MVVRRAFSQFHVVCQLQPFLDQEALLNHSCLGQLPYGLLQCASNGGTLEEYPEGAAPRTVYVTALLCELHWVLVFWIQFKMLVITFKALYVMGPSYPRNHLVPISLTIPPRQAGKVCYGPCRLENFDW